MKKKDAVKIAIKGKGIAISAMKGKKKNLLMSIVLNKLILIKKVWQR